MIKDIENNFLIYNVNQIEDKVIRIIMPQRFIGIPKAYITSNFDLYFLGETLNECEMHRIDLD